MIVFWYTYQVNIVWIPEHTLALLLTRCMPSWPHSTLSGSCVMSHNTPDVFRNFDGLLWPTESDQSLQCSRMLNNPYFCSVYDGCSHPHRENDCVGCVRMQLIMTHTFIVRLWPLVARVIMAAAKEEVRLHGLNSEKVCIGQEGGEANTVSHVLSEILT